MGTLFSLLVASSITVGSRNMRVVSLVPSWTETLICSGVDVVGRTRYCVHPADRVQSIPVVGGTKSIRWQAIKDAAPDCVLLDKEENPKWMADNNPFPSHVTHIEAVRNLSDACGRMGDAFESDALHRIATRWSQIEQRRPAKRSLAEIPGVLEWVCPLRPECEDFLYMIWTNPWMAASPHTFIGSVFETLGFGTLHVPNAMKYPEVSLEQLDPHHTLLLFSSEPFPFSKILSQLAELPFSSALVDGEAYGWFGIRTLEFLEKALED